MCVRPRRTYSQDQLLSFASNIPKDYRIPVELYKTLRAHRITKHQPTRRGCTGGSSVRKPIPVVCGSRNKYISGLYMKRGVNYNNLTQVPLTSIRSLPGKHMLMDCCLLNTRSVRNKAIIVKDYVVENNIDLVGLTETWLKPGVADAAKIEDLKPNGYKLPHEARKKKRAGGVGILHRSNIDIATKESVTFKSFEYMETVLRSPCKSVRVIAVYRPPPSKENRLTCKMFFEDFTVYLEQQTITNGCLLIIGDFNFHVEDVSDSNAILGTARCQ